MTTRIVHKYGGTSMGSTERIANVAKRVAKWHDAGYAMIVVPSAMSGETNRLLTLAKAVNDQPNSRELDMLAATGEQVSVALLVMALHRLGKQAVSYTGWQVPIYTDAAYTKARIERIDDTKIQQDLQADRIVIITGFQGVDAQGNITTLGRGGSDTSAVAVAVAVKAAECLIYTDVDGVYTTDPRIVSEARRLQTITFEEMMELASLGSKVLQIRSVEFAGNYRMPTRVLSSFTDPLIPVEVEMVSGTLISFEKESGMEQASVTGIACSRDEAKITVFRVLDHPGVAYQILGSVADANIEVDMIIQNQSVGGATDFTFTVPRGDYDKTIRVLQTQVKPHMSCTHIAGDNKVSKVSIVGVGMRSHVGVASRMFQTLSEAGVNIQMISTSEIKISVLIHQDYMELAVRALHRAFALSDVA